MNDSPRYVEVKCPRCSWVHASVPLSAVLSDADSPQHLARYFRCFRCGSPTSSFVPAKAEDAPPGCTLQPVVVGESPVALVDARKLDYHHALEAERAGLVLVQGALEGLEDLATGRLLDEGELDRALAVAPASADLPGSMRAPTAGPSRCDGSLAEYERTGVSIPAAEVVATLESKLAKRRKALWHCARPALAQAFLAQLGAGVITSTSVFAPRRTGKTVFLLKDLKPAAEAAGYRVAYVDLWQTETAPALAIVRGLEEALEPKRLRERAEAKLSEPIKNLKVEGSVGELKGEAELEFADVKATAAELGLRIDELVAKLVAKRPLLLLVDEAQELARTEPNEDAARSLRTALTKHREPVRVVYTGSSRKTLSHMFSDPQAPLYAPGLGVVDFPLLGRDLVEFAAERFSEATGGTRTLNVDVGVRVLEQMRHRPEPFLTAVMCMLAHPGMTPEEATEGVLKANA